MKYIVIVIFLYYRSSCDSLLSPSTISTLILIIALHITLVEQQPGKKFLVL